MKYLFINLFTDFQCVGGECPDTCCCGWTIRVDEESMNKYAMLPEPLRSQVLGNIGEDNGHHIMLLDEKGRCPFLNNENLCNLYTMISPDALCDTCQLYPRKIVTYYDTMLLTVSLSCPEVARLMLDYPDSLGFQFTEDDTVTDVTGADWLWYNELINGLVITTEILQERSAPLWKRLYLVLDIADIIQRFADEKRLSDLRNELQCYRSIDWRAVQYAELDTIDIKVNNMGAFINELFRAIAQIGEEIPYVMKAFMGVVLPEGEDELNCWRADFREQALDESEYEKIAIQLAFEYYMNALDGVRLDLNIVKILIFLILLHSQEMQTWEKGELTKEKRIQLISRLSRLLEHSAMFDTIADNIVRANDREKLYGLLLVLR